MKWRKRGVVWNTDGQRWWSRTHAMGPTPVVMGDTIRLFLTTLDEQGRGRPTFIDVAAEDPTRVLRVADRPLMDIGQPGTFDDNGLMAVSIVASADRLLMYYAGFELCTHVRYRIFTGLAISRDGGESFERVSRVPVLDRSSQELYFRCGPFAMLDGDAVRLWYVGGSEWTELNGKPMPIYDLRYLESRDGVHWPNQGRVVMDITDPDEHGFGRPWILRDAAGGYRMFYSIRKRSAAAYRLGYAESADGLDWKRIDEQMGLEPSPGEFDSDAIMYSAVIEAAGRTWCFYNGNNFGATGVGVAELLGD
ncbi:MAG TPA: hypothetical protein VFE82_16495 [Ramlibacter sp.]|jgi:hypothetical protein|uniref:hypothetical protein n=1 Tax=Ramlibacter sp. TaxID=1917967 RepID=UPI002D33D130|nr:hypothetical protein [Ramlibacter sp.]HZY20072.1 hypothetical protein [Ramlibacter sp.]